ncbi:hypothetical protein [uncultured Cedecea sp.]|uniref:hypothetical protein n=1 Tax=uncultured Cedecea sp. TaxID=988762 RepID=UPI00262861E5|nr:hypothetical protein [uncultured Cedecea sp.]
MNPVSLQIAYITGRSQPGHAQLSPLQSAFISKLARPQRRLVSLNFPYVCETGALTGIPSPGLLTASFYNSRDYFTSRNRQFRARYQRCVTELLTQAPQTVLLAGSCGLELFNNLDLSSEVMASTTIIAYGAVARKRPACRHILIQGHQDWLSRFYFRKVDLKVHCGHMNYLSNPDVLAICEDYIERIESRENGR